MNNFTHIEQKLKAFIKKYYTNELIKGSILFLSFGLLYFLFTLFIEYFLWLKPIFRTILFFSFIFIEIFLLIKYIIFPIVKLFGLKNGISYIDASRIIGNHFSEVDDKLLNILQLKQSENPSELLLASIEQKSLDLKPIPFLRAINFSGNKKYLKYLAIPLLVFFITFLFNKSIINDSLTRVVHYNKEYLPPAPFYFKLDNTNLKVIEGQPFTISVHTIGDIKPENVRILFNNQNYFLKETQPNTFTYTFNALDSDLDFNFEANGILSSTYHLNIIKTPKITDFKLFLNYPKHTNKQNTIVKNTGNVTVPEGTIVTWDIKTSQASSLLFKTNNDSIYFNKNKNSFTLKKRLLKSLDYQVSTSNQMIQNFEKLQYSIQVVSDGFPKIQIKTDIDSISRGEAQFIGQLSDDYGISKLQLVYYDRNNPSKTNFYSLPITNSNFQEFFYVFPNNLNLKEGTDYEFYFQLFDNDKVNGFKSVKSSTYHYRNKTSLEIQEDILKEQKQTIDNFNSTTKNTQKLTKSLDDFSKQLMNKSEMNWQDKKQFQDFLKRQKQYEQMLQRNTNKLQENLNELEKQKNPLLEEKKQDLQKRLDEFKALQKKKKLLDELQKLAEKLDKEGFLQKLDKLTQKNKQDERSLERILELTKRFYAEKKAEEIANKLQKLSKKQDNLSKQEDNNSKKQQQINKEFDKIKQDFKDLDKLNKELKKSMSLPKTGQEQKEIESDLNQAEEKLKESEESSDNQKESKSSDAKKKQKAAARKMQRLSQKMQQSMMASSGEVLEEDLDNLRRIIDNLIRFSTEQEDLMLQLLSNLHNQKDYSKHIKKQQVLKEYFEHIDDSIYSLSLRMPKMSVKIQEDIVDAHYNLNQSLYHFPDNKLSKTTKNQQFTMTAANNLASFLSDLLDSSQNPMQGQGQGKGSGKGKGMGKGKGNGKGFSLPDIIQKQSDLMKEAQQKGGKKGGNKSGGKDGSGTSGNSGKNGKDGKGGKSGKNGSNGKDSEQQKGELYKIYQQQNALRQQFQDMIDKAGSKGQSGNKALKQMEDLERMLLKQGLSQDVLQKMQLLKHELLKLDKAVFEQGEEKKRKSETNYKEYFNRSIKAIPTQKIFFNPNEILNRQALPLKTFYKKKVQIYFQNNN